MRRKRRTFEDRDDLAHWAVNIWRDALAFKKPHKTVMEAFSRLYASPKWKRIPQYQREYVRGYARSFETQVIDRHYLEHGSWVRMPDGAEWWFGTQERIEGPQADIGGIGFHRYIYENEIPERSGIYWVPDSATPRTATDRWAHADTGRAKCGPGERPFFIPALDFAEEDRKRVEAVAAEA